MARARRTRVSAPRGTAAATGASAGAASENNFTVPAVPPSSKLSALSDFLLPELVSLRLCAQRAARGLGDARSGAVRRGAERRRAVHTPDPCVRCAYRRFGSLGVLSLASTCKQYATGLAREARRVRARLDAMKVDMMKLEAWRSARAWRSASMLCTGTACTGARRKS